MYIVPEVIVIVIILLCVMTIWLAVIAGYIIATHEHEGWEKDQ